jgi:hypothetical protein
LWVVGWERMGKHGIEMVLVQVPPGSGKRAQAQGTGSDGKRERGGISKPTGKDGRNNQR